MISPWKISVWIFTPRGRAGCRVSEWSGHRAPDARAVRVTVDPFRPAPLQGTASVTGRLWHPGCLWGCHRRLSPAPATGLASPLGRGRPHQVVQGPDPHEVVPIRWGKALVGRSPSRAILSRSSSLRASRVGTEIGKAKRCP